MSILWRLKFKNYVPTLQRMLALPLQTPLEPVNVVYVNNQYLFRKLYEIHIHEQCE
jgi:hypothetical protein